MSISDGINAGANLITALTLAAAMLFFHRRLKNDEERLARVSAFHQSGLESYKALWAGVGAICTPGTSTNDRELTWHEMVEARDEIDAAYRAHGHVLGPRTRTWMLLLREKVAESVRCTAGAKPPFHWNNKEWPAIWLIKTGFRFSLHAAMKDARYESSAIAMAHEDRGDEMKEELLRKLELVDILAGVTRDGRRELVELVVGSVQDSGRLRSLAHANLSA